MQCRLGLVDVSAQLQQNCCSESQHFLKWLVFFKTTGNAAVVLEFAERAFDDMALLVRIPVNASLHVSISLGLYHCGDDTRCEPIEQGIRVIHFVGYSITRMRSL